MNSVILALMLAAAPYSSETAVTTTSVTTKIAYDGGNVWLRCSEPTYYKAVATINSTASTSDASIRNADLWIPVTVSAGQYLALKARSTSGKCWVTQDGVPSVDVTDTTVQRLTLVDAGITRATIGTASVSTLGVGTIVSAPIFDGGAHIGTTGNFSGAVKGASWQSAGIANASEVWSDKFDGGSIVATTINSSGATVLGSHLSATVGQTALGNFWRDGGSKECFNADCTDYCYNPGGGNATQTCVSGSGTGWIFNGNAAVSTVNGSIYSYYNVGVGISPGGGASGGGTLWLQAGATRKNTGSCDQRSDTTYPNVCNQVSGKGRIANGNGAAGFDINNGLVVATTAICQATFATTDATCTQISCAADAGNMTFDTNANCTATTDFDWALETGQ